MLNLTAAMNEIVAANVKTLRDRLGLSQAAFADELGVVQASISRWEKGSEPRAQELTRLANMAGCSVQKFTTQLITGEVHAGELRATPPSYNALMLPVYLPSEADLAVMFGALLEGLKNERNQDVLALRLAQRLPVALAQTVAHSTAVAGALGLPTGGEGVHFPEPTGAKR